MFFYAITINKSHKMFGEFLNVDKPELYDYVDSIEHTIQNITSEFKTLNT